MLQVQISPVPTQEISFNADNAFWKIKLYQAIDFVCADISRGGEPVITGVRCFVGLPLIPYPYLYEPNYGNFVFDSDVDWTEFGNICNLYYLTNDELGQLQSLIENS